MFEFMKLVSVQLVTSVLTHLMRATVLKVVYVFHRKPLLTNQARIERQASGVILTLLKVIVFKLIQKAVTNFFCGKRKIRRRY
jgi:hypothetical protein